MSVDCKGCGDCCRYILLPLEFDHHDFYEWLRLHGLKIENHRGRAHVRIEIPCKGLKGDKCAIYQGRPSMCALAPCIKEE